MTLRLPNIYHFNPTCEYAVANGNASWQPNRLLQKMESDLATLPLFFAGSNDYILVDEPPSQQFIDSLKQVKTDIPNFISKKEALGDQVFAGQPKNGLLPWGWSPVEHKLLSPLKPSCSNEFKASPVFDWKPEYREYYSKKFALGILKTILKNYPSEHFLSEGLLTQVCTTRDEFELLLRRWGKLMVKAPWSSSGRGLQPIRKTPIHPKVWEKLMGIVKEQGYAIVEPFLNKVLDLAFQFKLKNGRVSYLGVSNFTADSKGQYQGNCLNGLPQTTSKEVTNFIKFIPEKIIAPLKNIIENSKLAENYEGFFGVDTLIYTDKNNNLKINPCLEINLRQNMGLLSLEIEKMVYHAQKGFYRTYYKPGNSFLHFCTEMKKQHPLRIVGNRIESGFFPITEATNLTQFGAYILV